MTKETLANHGNEEVIDVNQDPLGVQAKKVRMDGDHENHRSPMGQHRSSTKHGCGSQRSLEACDTGEEVRERTESTTMPARCSC
ncbi:unnamed protein product [Musa acuminata var. zebrina]